MQMQKGMTSDRVSAAWIWVFILALASMARADKLLTDVSQVKPGPISVNLSDSSLNVSWQDSDARHWSTSFALAQKQPLIHDISVDGQLLVSNANPIYRCEVGKRRGGWDAFSILQPHTPMELGASKPSSDRLVSQRKRSATAFKLPLTDFGWASFQVLCDTCSIREPR
jgi:hypothetical protein